MKSKAITIPNSSPRRTLRARKPLGKCSSLEQGCQSEWLVPPGCPALLSGAGGAEAESRHSKKGGASIEVRRGQGRGEHQGSRQKQLKGVQEEGQAQSFSAITSIQST